MDHLVYALSRLSNLLATLVVLDKCKHINDTSNEIINKNSNDMDSNKEEKDLLEQYNNDANVDWDN